MGASFKENSNDIRNSKVLELAEKLNKNFRLQLYDKIVDYNLLKQNTSCKIITKFPNKAKYDSILALTASTVIKRS